jgi:hypothetical protein
MFTEIYFLIEGNDDLRFLQRIAEPILKERYDYIGYFQYTRRPKKKVQGFIRSVISRKADFLCMTDIDVSPCVTAKKEQIKKDKLGTLDDSRILVVKSEIESWYLAGLDDERCRRLRLPAHRETESVDKEQFRQSLSGSKLGCTINCMIEILKNYDIATAKSRNGSFDYFHRKYLHVLPVRS